MRTIDTSFYNRFPIYEAMIRKIINCIRIRYPGRFLLHRYATSMPFLFLFIVAYIGNRFYTCSFRAGFFYFYLTFFFLFYLISLLYHEFFIFKLSFLFLLQSVTKRIFFLFYIKREFFIILFI